MVETLSDAERKTFFAEHPAWSPVEGRDAARAEAAADAEGAAAAERAVGMACVW